MQGNKQKEVSERGSWGNRQRRHKNWSLEGNRQKSKTWNVEPDEEQIEVRQGKGRLEENRQR